ncbi:MAG: nitroreductase family protein [Salinivirgaceae bacterium]|jgi:nitroreductase|nr:nitroreductase family protein [Salinivirgaceae bacterium]MDD4747218.1 nitroreductase family protein [Salinivirgaceae bacterium]MDY0279255.1 nitroreductase family protein [Salinivirgaceae bacterium]
MKNSIFSHRSIRKFKSKGIGEATLRKIINAGIRASNTGNMQVYSIIVTQDPIIREQLWDQVHFKQNMVKQAPVHVTFCVDVNRFHKWCEISNTEISYDNFLWFINGSVDAVLASQNTTLEAENEGLGVCYLGTVTYNADKVIQILDLPKGVIPITAIVMGYPDEDPDLTDRLPYEGVVHMEKYQDYSLEAIKNIHKEKEESEFYKNIVAENNVPNLATVFTEKRYKKQDNIHMSNAFLTVLKDQGFFNQ